MIVTLQCWPDGTSDLLIDSDAGTPLQEPYSKHDLQRASRLLRLALREQEERIMAMPY